MYTVPLSHRRLGSVQDGLGFESTALLPDPSGAEEWTIAVSFGTPPQVAHLIFDTGSADLWVRAHAYNASKSESASKKGSVSSNKWQIQYGGGGVRGSVVRDTVQVQQSHGASLQATHAAFAVAANSWKGFDEPSGNIEESNKLEGGSEISQDAGIFATLKGDGVLGMAFKSLNAVRQDKQATLMDRFVEQSQVRLSAFAIYLAAAAAAPGGGCTSQSFVAFGVDTSIANLTGLVSGPTLSTKVAPGGFWMFAAPSVRVVGAQMEVNEGKSTFSISEAERSIEKLCHSKCFAMVDSGSSFLGVPRELYPATVRALTSHLVAEHGSSACTPLESSSNRSTDREGASAGANSYALQACRCSRGDLLRYPRLEIELSAGESLALGPSDYLQLLPKRSQTPWCFLGIRPANHPSAEAPTFILGSSFLKAYYTHFDYSARQLSFTRTTSSINGLFFFGSESPSDSEPSPVASFGNTIGVTTTAAFGTQGLGGGSTATALLMLLLLVACVLPRLWCRKSSVRSLPEYELVEVES